MQVRPDREAAIRLGAGESLFVYLRAGTTVASTAGQFRLTGAPRWLGGQVFRPEVTLVGGESQLIEESGWVTLTAMHGGSVSICRDQAPLQVMDWLRKTASLLMPGRTARACA